MALAASTKPHVPEYRSKRAGSWWNIEADGGELAAGGQMSPLNNAFTLLLIWPFWQQNRSLVKEIHFLLCEKKKRIRVSTGTLEVDLTWVYRFELFCSLQRIIVTDYCVPVPFIHCLFSKLISCIVVQTHVSMCIAKHITDHNAYVGKAQVSVINE